jgi:hypothetical protein
LLNLFCKQEADIFNIFFWLSAGKQVAFIRMPS